MKLLLILPYDNLYQYSKGYTRWITYEPLTLSVLAALVPQQYDIEIETIDEGMEKKDYHQGFYDLVAISTVASSANRAYELARILREKGSYVMIGGHHATLMPEEASQHADTVFVGPAYETWPQFFKDYFDGNPQRLYSGKEKGRISTPFIPRRDLVNRKYYLKQPSIIGNFGCTNGCAFCSVSKFYQANDLMRPVESVIQEIRETKAKEMIFLDPNIYSNREYTLELLEELKHLNVKWAGLSTQQSVWDDEMLNAMVESGCAGILLGFESLCQENLNHMGKEHYQVADYKKTIQRLHSAKLFVNVTMMLGFDHDTVESLRTTPDLLEDIGVDLVRYGLVTPFPGTPLYQNLEEQGRILTQDWSLYDSVHCVFEPAQMSARELEKVFLEVWEETYTWGRMAKRMKGPWEHVLTKAGSYCGFKVYTKQVRQVLDEYWSR